MDASCRTRPASRADLATVAAIEARSFSDPWPADAFAAHLRECFLVAEVEGALVAYLVARTMGDEAEILDLAVLPEARGRGVGRALLDDALRALHQGGARQVFLEVRAANAAAQRLYRSRGFRTVGRRPDYYRQPTEDALVLARGLPADA
jgi:ribosomal-protein-alanine N-acetyltransferase